MDFCIHENHTLYAIFLNVPKSQEITIGKLGRFYFPKGMYIYVGSGKKNIGARIQRHLQIEKKLRWHFDYLRPFGKITKIITYEKYIGECELAEKLRKEYDGDFLIHRFGSSDCRCPSHLIYFQTKDL